MRPLKVAKMIEVAIGALVLVLVLAACWLTKRKGKSKVVEEAAEVRQVKKKIIAPKKQKFKASKVVPTHIRYVNAFKGFEAPVVDFDVKPGLCAVACQDGTLKLFEFKSVTEDFRFSKIKLEADVPSAIAVSQRG